VRSKALLERPVRIDFKRGGETVMGFKERYARPAEMMILKLKENDIARLGELEAGELTVEIA
jgi:hypothetical protein